MLVRAEIYLAGGASFPAAIYFFTGDTEKAFRVFLVCFVVPQPFLVYALRDRIFRRRR
jgi:hypothetical protein